MSLAKKLAELISEGSQSKTSPYDTTGVVKRIEGRTAYVVFDSGYIETPVDLTIACEKGDIVVVRVSGTKARLTGNLTAPPTDDKKAREAEKTANKAYKAARSVVERADAGEFDGEDGQDGEDGAGVYEVRTEYCLSTSNSQFIPYQGMEWSEDLPEYVPGCYYWTRTVIYYDDDDETVVYGDPVFSLSEQLSAETRTALESTNNHFWHDSTGAYVTEEEGTYATGYATRITNSGILQSHNNKLMSSWTNSGVSFYKSDGETALASFGVGGISFADDVPFTVGNNTSFIKWVRENGAWKIKICADSIEMGGQDVMVDGDAGKWYTGTRITGTSSSPTIFPNSGISDAKVGDMYLNTSASNTYRCTTGGAASTARWVFASNIKGADGEDGQDGRDGIDVTSQYMTFASSGSNAGLNIYSGSKTSASYNKTYLNLNASSGMKMYINDTLRASYASTGNTFYFTDWYGDNVSMTLGVVNDSDGDASAGLTTTSYSMVIDPGDRVYLQGNLSGTGWIDVDGEIETASRFRSVTTYEVRGSGTTANIYVNSNGAFMRTAASSSRRYKEDISPIDPLEFNIHALYDVPVVQFRFKRGFFADDAPDSAYNLRVGIIAEELYEHYPAAVEFEDDRIETWSERNIIPPMLALIQEQKAMIDMLDKRTESIERRIA